MDPRFLYSQHPMVMEELVTKLLADGWPETSIFNYFESLEGSGNLAIDVSRRVRKERDQGIQSFSV